MPTLYSRTLISRGTPIFTAFSFGSRRAAARGSGLRLSCYSIFVDKSLGFLDRHACEPDPTPGARASRRAAGFQDAACQHPRACPPVAPTAQRSVMNARTHNYSTNDG